MNRIFTLCLLAFAGCHQAEPKPAEPTSHETWVKVQSGDSTSALEVPARVVGGAGAMTMISVPLRAMVVRVHVNIGDVVDAGALVVDVVMPELLEAAGRGQGARERLQAWSERLTQLTQLRADGLAKSLEVSEAAAKVAESKADLQAARAVLLSAGVNDGARLLNGNGVFSVRAPVAGVVTSVSVSAGESREPSGGSLVQLTSAGPVRVEARFTSQLAEGTAEFIGAGESTPLTLISRAPGADSRDGTFLAWFTPLRPLPAGLLGRVAFHGAAGIEAMKVPAKAIVRVEGKTSVETRHGSVPVEVVRCETRDCFVRGELTPDDEVSAP